MRVKVFDIDWCIEEEDLLDTIMPNLYPNEETYRKAVEKKSGEIIASLPKEVIVNVNELNDEVIADAVSNATGWLVYTFQYEVL